MFQERVQALIYTLTKIFSVPGVHLISPLHLHFAETHGIEHDHVQASSVFPSEIFLLVSLFK